MTRKLEPREDAYQVLRSFVRDEISWARLQGLGASIAFERGALRLHEPPLPYFEPTPADLAAGILSNRDTASKPEWASIMIATGMVDLEGLERHPRGNLLVDALWTLADHRALETHVLRVVRSLLEEEAGDPS